MPVLYLRGCTTGGAVLAAETVWQDVCAPNSWPPSHLEAANWLTDSVRLDSHHERLFICVLPACSNHKMPRCHRQTALTPPKESCALRPEACFSRMLEQLMSTHHP